MFERIKSWFVDAPPQPQIQQIQPDEQRSIDIGTLLAQVDAYFEGAKYDMPATYNGYVMQGYRQNPDIYSCIRATATAAAGIPWYVERNGVRIDSHPLKKLIDRPNPKMSTSRFIDLKVTFLLLSGNTYTLRVGPGRDGTNPNQPPFELYLLKPDLVEIKKGLRLGEVLEYTYNPQGRPIHYAPELISHLPLPNPSDDWYGLAPMEAARRSVDFGNESRKWNYKLLKNSAKPSGHWEPKVTLSKTQVADLKEQSKQYQGADNVGKMPVANGVEWVQDGLSPVDMDWAAGVEFSTLDICKVFGVPPEIIGDSKNRTYSNYQEARKSFYTETVLPLMDSIQDEYNTWLTPLYGDGVALKYDVDAVEALQEDRQPLRDWALKAFEAGAITAEQLQQLSGLEY